MWHQREEFFNTLHSRAGSGTGCPRQEQKTTYVKLTLPNTGNELKVAVWASGTPKQFVLCVCSNIHEFKQIGLDMNCTNAKKAVVTTELDTELSKTEYAQVHNSKKNKL